MAISKELRALNIEIAQRETARDEGWFDTMLAPEFRMRRANGDRLDKAEFIDDLTPDVEPGIPVPPPARRRTTVVAGIERDLRASVSCVVAMEQADGEWKTFYNHRLFVRDDEDAEWQLLAWANESTGDDVTIVEQPALEFTGDEDTRDKLKNLSAVYRDGNVLWAACDELNRLERLTRSIDEHGDTRYTNHRPFSLEDLGVSLPGPLDEEIDIEGMDLADDGYLWLVGSHSRTRSRLDAAADTDALEKFTKRRRRRNRQMLFRIALEGEGADAAPVEETTGTPKHRTAALIGDLTTALRADPYLGKSTKIPAKENGLDVEGLAVVGDRILVGLRGPVLRSWATVLEVEPTPDPKDPSRLTLGDPPFRRHLLPLGDLGVRDLCRDGDDALILAGPSMGLDGPVRVYRWRNPTDRRRREIVSKDDLQVIAEVPFGDGDDHAEGIAVVSTWGEPTRLLIVYDSPSKHRLTDLPGKLIIRADETTPLPLV